MAHATLALMISLGASASAATFTVTSSGDDGAGTLRQAIIDANAAAGADTIEFDSAVTAITLTTAVLPTVSETLIIDGTVNHTAGTQVELNGNGLTGNGLTLGAASCEVYGLYIHGFTGHGIDSSASGAISGSAAKRNVVSGNTSDGIRLGSTGATVQGNYIGTDTTGLVDAGNGGQGISATAATATIRGNVISGNALDGINATGAGLGIYGNMIGLGSDGATVLRNDSHGITLNSGATGTIIGTTAVADRNVVSGNGTAYPQSGIVCLAANATIAGNYIGTDSTGLAEKGNFWHGIYLDGSNSIARGNVIAGNGGDGINALGGSSNGIYGNIIGLGSDGATVVRNDRDGIYIGASVSGVTIGTSALADRNIVSGNGADTSFTGIEVAGANATITNNYVGTDSTGLIDKGNGGNGLTLTGSGAIVRGNVIAGNGSDGINATSTGLGIYGNTIGLGSDAATLIPNDTDGIDMSSTATGAIIGTTAVADRNIVSGNGTSSSFHAIKAAGANATITNNYVGTDITGLIDKGNAGRGISLTGAGATVRGNVISGNGTSGVYATALGLEIYGNVIGLGNDGSTLLGNGYGGVYLDGAADAIIGTSTPADRNIISGNSVAGIMTDASVTGLAVTGNYIGTDATGLLDRGNLEGGVALFTGADSATIRGNVISGNGSQGIFAAGAALQVYGNTIGLGSDGTTAIGNNQNGIELSTGATGAIIGSAALADRNIVSSNGVSPSFHGIKVGGADATITNNYVGTDSAGLVAHPNSGTGIIISAIDTTLRGNVISGNTLDGVNCGSAGLGAYGNLVGLGADGTTVIGNGSDGIDIGSGATGAIIGTAATADRNIISGNGSTNAFHGLVVSGASATITNNCGDGHHWLA